MKKLVTHLFLVLLTCQISAQTLEEGFLTGDGWRWLNPSPFNGTFNTIRYVNEDLVLVGGSQGIILRSEDKGITWEQAEEVPGIASVLEIAIDQEGNGIARTDEGFWLTEDAGISWSEMTTPSFGDPVVTYYLDSIFVSDRNTFYWLNTESNNIEHLVTYNYSDADFPEVIATTIEHSAYPIYCRYIGNGDTGGADEFRTRVYFKDEMIHERAYERTIDDGNTMFETVEISDTLIVIQLNEALASIGGGQWSRSTVFMEYNLNDEVFTVSGGCCSDNADINGYEYEASSSTIYYSWPDVDGDEGKSILREDFSTGDAENLGPGQNTITDIEFLDANFGLTTADNSEVYFSANSGDFWQSSLSESTQDISGVQGLYFRGDGIGYAAGINDFQLTIYKTVDGGVTWDTFHDFILDFETEMISTTISKFLVSDDEQTIWAVAGDRLVYTDVDRVGDYLTTIDGSDFQIIDIEFVSNLTGYILTSQGIFFCTHIGLDGLTPDDHIDQVFDFTTINATIDLKSMHFLDEDNGFVAGANGSVLRTSDGADTWDDRSIAGVDINAIQMIDGDNVVLAGNSGLVARSYDGGGFWYTAMVSGDDLYNITFFNENEGYLVDSEGYYYTNAGGVDTDFSSQFEFITNPGDLSTNHEKKTPGIALIGFGSSYAVYAKENSILSFGDVPDFMNEDPTAIEFSVSQVDPDAEVGDTVGEFSTIDPDEGDTHTYSLVSGEGDDDNSFFTISGSSLVLDQEIGSAAGFSFRVRSTDQSGGSLEEVFQLDVVTNNAPTDIQFSATTIDAELGTGGEVGSFTTTDADDGDIHTYALIAGEGDDDNGFFSIDGASLILEQAIDSEAGFTFRVESTDQGGASFEKSFSITVTSGNNAPTDIQLSSSTIETQQAVGTEVGTFTTTDDDTGDTHTYSLVAGAGDDNNDSFVIDGDALQSNEIFLIDGPLTIRVESEDGAGGTFSKQFIITVEEEGALSIEAIENVRVFPIPATRVFSVEGTEGFESVSLIDLDGKIVKTFKIQSAASFSVGDIQSGIYLVVLKGAKKQKMVGKLLIR